MKKRRPKKVLSLKNKQLRAKKRKWRLWGILLLFVALRISAGDVSFASLAAFAKTEPMSVAELHSAQGKQDASEVAQQKDTDMTDATDHTITIKLEKDGSIKEIDSEEYVIGVVSGEMPVNFDMEALKAQAVAARSYGVRQIQDHGVVSADPAKGQCYINIEERQANWGSHFAEYEAKITEAVEQTKDEVLYWQGQYADTLYYASCGGEKTQAAQDAWGNFVPYLVSVSCNHGTDPHSDIQTEISIEELANKLQIETKDCKQIKIRERNSSGRVEEVSFGEHIFSGEAIRRALGLKSTLFTIQRDQDRIIIQTDGYGHGVGMCQYGAEYHAEQGWDYRRILAFYYPQTELGKINE